MSEVSEKELSDIELCYKAMGLSFSDNPEQVERTVTSRVQLGELSRPVLGGTSDFVPSYSRRIAPLKQLGTNG